jgi:ketosteroid isomerase-like protein
MKGLISLLFIFIFAFSIATAQDDVRSVIEDNNARWEKAMMEKDMNTIISMYDEDVYSLPSYSPMMRGRQDLERHLRKEMESGMEFNEVNFNTVEVRHEGNIAVEVGTYEMSMKMASGEDMNDEGKYITVWERKGNDWKVIMEAWNSDHNPWAKMRDHHQMDHKE